MTAIDARGVRIEVESEGPADAPAFLLIRGLSSQLIHWPRPLVEALLEAGFRVVRFDNRDAGLSQKWTEAGAPEVVSVVTGMTPAPYALADMARDAVGVLDALGIERAHAVGMSLGGMVAQHLAFSHADRLQSVTSVMSTSGEPGLPPPTPEAMEALTTEAKDPNDRESVIEVGVRAQRVFASPGYPPTETEMRSYVERGYDRCYCPDGSARQMAAVIADGSRAERLRGVRVPMLVLHGADDPLIALACGEDTARHVPGARFTVVPGMGHDVTNALSPVLAAHLIAHARAHAA